MIIGACGFGSTGSSVITDYLKEFDDIIVNDSFEMAWVSRPDGLIDLERAVMHPKNRTADSITAIERYIALVDSTAKRFEAHGLSAADFKKSAEKFIDEITTTTWYSYQYSYSLKSKDCLRAFAIRYIIPRIERKKGCHANIWPLEKVRFSVKPANFYTAAQAHVDDILTGFGMDQNRICAADQPFPGNDPQACFPFFKDPYAIVVDRDPRDNFVFARTRMLGKFHYMPINDVMDFIAYYRALCKDQPYLQPDPRVLRIHFEDMIYEYEKTTELVRSFLHLPENPRPKSVFDPELSIANTQVFKRFPQFADDIKIIEAELSEYLFDFSKYPEPDKTKKMFFGKSPKNEAFKRKYSE